MEEKMLKLVEHDEDKVTLERICARSALGCKIISIGKMYGFDKKFACFWIDDKEEAALCLLDSTMIVCGTLSDSDEIRPFLNVIAAKEVICAVRNADIIGGTVRDKGEIMMKTSAGNTGNVQQPQSDVNIREIYEFLTENDMPPGEFEAFYLDFSHRLRHSGADVLIKRKNGEMVGCLLINSITDESAIISAVAVKSAYRRQGIGAALISEAEKMLAGRKIYIFKENSKNDEFYKNLGFRKTDSWTTLML